MALGILDSDVCLRYQCSYLCRCSGRQVSGQAQVFKSTPFGALHCKYTRVLTLRMSCQVANSHKLLPHKVLRYKVIRHKVIRGLVMAVWKGKGEGKGC